jgi:transcriptional regulator with XRE-family HTH domain
VVQSEKQRAPQVGQQALHFGALLKTFRHRYGLKQLDILAQLSGWTQTAYSRLESGELAPAFDQLPALYSALHRAGIAFTPQDRRQFVTLAHERIEAKRSRQEHRTEREWDALRLTLARAEPKADEPQDHTFLSKPSPSSAFLRETRHLIGREDWLRSVLALLDETLPKKRMCQN